MEIMYGGHGSLYEPIIMRLWVATSMYTFADVRRLGVYSGRSLREPRMHR